MGPGAFPADAVTALGYEVAQHGEGRWNGVAVISRVGMADVAPGLPGDPGFPGPVYPPAPGQPRPADSLA